MKKNLFIMFTVLTCVTGFSATLWAASLDEEEAKVKKAALIDMNNLPEPTQAEIDWAKSEAQKSISYKSPLLIAIRSKKVPLIKYFAKKEPESLNPQVGQTPLVLALLRSLDSAVIKFLLRAGADVKKLNCIGMTPLGMALVNANPDLEIVQMLIDEGADVNQTVGFIGVRSGLFLETILNEYVELPNIKKAFNLLQKAGLKVNRINERGENVLNQIIGIKLKKGVPIIPVLQEAGYDFNSSAAFYRYHGSDKDLSRVFDSVTPLIASILRSNYPTVFQLIDAGVDVNKFIDREEPARNQITRWVPVGLVATKVTNAKNKEEEFEWFALLQKMIQKRAATTVGRLEVLCNVIQERRERLSQDLQADVTVYDQVVEVLLRAGAQCSEPAYQDYIKGFKDTIEAEKMAWTWGGAQGIVRGEISGEPANIVQQFLYGEPPKMPSEVAADDEDWYASEEESRKRLEKVRKK